MNFLYCTVHDDKGELLCLVLVPEGASAGLAQNSIREDLNLNDNVEFRITEVISKAEAESIRVFNPDIRLLEYVEVDDIVGLRPIQGYRDAMGGLVA